MSRSWGAALCLCPESTEKETLMVSSFSLNKYFILCSHFPEVSFQHFYVGEEFRIIEVFCLGGAAVDAGHALDADAAYGHTVGFDGTQGAGPDAVPAVIAVLCPCEGLGLEEYRRGSVLPEGPVVLADLA